MVVGFFFFLNVFCQLHYSYKSVSGGLRSVSPGG